MTIDIETLDTEIKRLFKLFVDELKRDQADDDLISLVGCIERDMITILWKQQEVAQ